MENTQHILARGGVGVMATDTLYGLVGRALDRQAVERIYALKNRRPDKPFIILIGDIGDLARFGIMPSPQLRSVLGEYWPGPVSVVLPCPHESLRYLHRGSETLAFRLPAKTTLRRLLRRVGPLVAPSANPEAMAPAATLAEARAYFGERADFYQAGLTAGKPSRLITLTQGRVSVLRA